MWHMIQCSLNNAVRDLKTLVIAHLLITVILIGVRGYFIVVLISLSLLTDIQCFSSIYWPFVFWEMSVQIICPFINRSIDSFLLKNCSSLNILGIRNIANSWFENDFFQSGLSLHSIVSFIGQKVFFDYSMQSHLHI
jgi:hypothetical protein